MNRVAKAEGSSSFSGLNSINFDDSEDDPFTELADDFASMAQFKEVSISENKSTTLAPVLNLGVEGKILDDKLSLGLLYSNRMIPDNNIQEFTTVLTLEMHPFMTHCTLMALKTHMARYIVLVLIGACWYQS